MTLGTANVRVDRHWSPPTARHRAAVRAVALVVGLHCSRPPLQPIAAHAGQTDRFAAFLSDLRVRHKVKRTDRSARPTAMDGVRAEHSSLHLAWRVWEVEVTDQFVEWWSTPSDAQREAVTDRVDLLADELCASTSGNSGGAISKLEHSDDVRVSTLRQYLDALWIGLSTVKRQSLSSAQTEVWIARTFVRMRGLGYFALGRVESGVQERSAEPPGPMMASRPCHPIPELIRP